MTYIAIQEDIMMSLIRGAEDAVLEVLLGAAALSIEELTTLLPDYTWSEVLQAVDLLSRRGEIVLKRTGFQYEVSRKRAA